MLNTQLCSVFVTMALTLATAVQAANKAGTMEVVGNSGVSGQMMFLQSNGQVAILDKVENNPIKRPNGKGPAAAVFYNYKTNEVKADNLQTNPFCAGGMTLGDGRWLVVGGNKAVGTGGVTAKQNKSPYYNTNGGRSIRFLQPCSGDGCVWQDQDPKGLQKERWYATIEPMSDGHAMILGGMRDGGFVPSDGSNEPSYEFYPDAGGVYHLDILQRTVPLSLYPITYLLSNNEVFIQANRQAIIWNTDTLKETTLPNIPSAPRVYPASGGSALLPMTPANNYSQTILFCGGTSLGSAKKWGNEGGPATMVTERAASTSCTQISPLGNKQWEDQDDLPEGRSMGQFIQLPDGKLWFGNGVTTGVAGYTTDPNSPGKPVGTSFGDNPSYKPLVYDPSKPSGQRWKQVGKTDIGRLYHSTATLLPDSSILISGSNPSPDVTSKQKWKTEYRVERWYPEFYDRERPSNKGLPTSIGYGGSGFSLTMSSADEAKKTKVVVLRTGFSTHAMNMGQRMLELRTATDGSTVKVSSMPPNAALFAPGPALAFVVVDGVPSQGKFVTIGNGKIGKQNIGAETNLGSVRAVSKATTAHKETDSARSGKHKNMIRKVVDKIADEVSSLVGEDKTRADKLANALSGSPVSGQKLSTSLENIFSDIQSALQNSVEAVADKFSKGEIKEHLSG